MVRIQTQRWDPAEYLRTEEDIAAYLEAASVDGDPELMAAVLDVVKRASDVSELATKWTGPDGALGAYIREESKNSIASYRSQPNNLREDANQEEDISRGGYANRQLFELMQNSADALAGSDGEYIWIRLTPTHLYCADNGKPIDNNGVRALLFSHLSSKRGTSEIGRFGLGFKSLLSVSDTLEFFSRTGSFRFDRKKATKSLNDIAPDLERYPVLRLAEPINPWLAIETDPNLHEMVHWATNIVRLSLKFGAHQSLDKQAKEFPAEFLLFVRHVGRLVLQTDEQETARIVALTHEDNLWTLDDAGNKNLWMIESGIHKLSADAKSDSRSLDDTDEVPIWWAAPVERLSDPGKFWAFFPTMTQSLLAGILNAPWKTNEDRQNLLPGVYNDELIDAAATMVARALPRLSSPEDPAQHLDALPRRSESADSQHSGRLRDQLHLRLQECEVVPDQAGNLRRIRDVRYAPRELTADGRIASDALKKWTDYDQRPLNWAHNSTLTRNRLSTIGRLQPDKYETRPGGGVYIGPRPLPRATIAEWLEELVKNADPGDCAIKASKAAVQTAALIPESTREGVSLGDVVLTTEGNLLPPKAETVFLSGGHARADVPLVHPELEADAETLTALRELGIRTASVESVFRKVASHLLRKDYKTTTRESQSDEAWCEFWQAARNVDQQAAVQIIQGFKGDWSGSLCVRTIDSRWHFLYEALLPGEIVPEDGSRDSSVAVDLGFHEPDLSLLRQLGACEVPRERHELSPTMMLEFLALRRGMYIKSDLPYKPHWEKLNFTTNSTSGPLDVLKSLSEEGKALYTWHLLGLSDTYKPWTMRHDTRDVYPYVNFESPAVELLRQYGRIKTGEGIRPFSDGLGEPPLDRGVFLRLNSHPLADSFRHAFGLATETEMPREAIGEDTPVPLLDVWPGLKSFLSEERIQLQLVRCNGFRWFDNATDAEKPDCVINGDSVYVTRKVDEKKELQSVLRKLNLWISDERIEWILLGLTTEDVQKAREAVRSNSTDEERLLAAVGEFELRRRLPKGLLSIIQDSEESLSGIQVAQTAIATFHTGALREYRHALLQLDPPKQWAGRPRAVQFVRSLGFSDEWAGDANTRRDPFVEVDGPFSLPKLHDYQRRIVDRVRDLIRSSGAGGKRRGMISMPTGSGKTRVAVQAIVEAMREDGFEGGILWIADRDELCEQAVEAWRQVWASEGAQATRLRISRMWAGQPQPLPTGEMHVIVATIQTLFAKITGQPDSYRFLADFKLLVFDEAHRSVAPTFTSVMEDLGLTRWRRDNEPILIGLTATPYRGHDERETARLVNRYGSNRLDADAFSCADPEAVIEELQSMRVLAQAEHAIIEGGEFRLSYDELRQSQKAPWLPRSVEYRIASDVERTRRIIGAYREHINSDWPTLVFATSVEHSQIVAALLSRNGIKARSVSGDTDPSVRRRIVEEFRAGEVRALVNHGVFREGFDAPKTRAIVVARPVYSPNLYFQMIGRGLRGVKNGGNDRSLILNVRDNIENFERKLAFSELDWLWA